MPSYLDQYFALNEQERNIVRTAAKTGDSPLSRQMFKLYFPKLTTEEIPKLIKELSGVN